MRVAMGWVVALFAGAGCAHHVAAGPPGVAATAASPGAPGAASPSAPAADGTSSTGGWPAAISRVEVVPGKLTVAVYARTLPNSAGSPIDCWTFVSDGLWALRQKELLMTVVRRPGESRDAFPRQLLDFYAVVHRFAGEGRLVDEGAISRLADEGPPLLAGSELRGVLYAPGRLTSGVPVLAPHLTAVLVTADEAKAAASFGVTRVLRQLAKRTRAYPTPEFADRDRKSLLSSAEQEKSLLKKVRLLHLWGALVDREAVDSESVASAQNRKNLGPGRVVLRVRPGAIAMLDEALGKLPAGAPLGLLTGVDTDVPAAFTWSPGQAQATVVGEKVVDTRLIGGSFVLFVPQQAEDGALLLEDGFALFLRDQTWASLRQALQAHQPWSVRGDGDKMGFGLVWPEQGATGPSQPAKGQ